MTLPLPRAARTKKIPLDFFLTQFDWTEQLHGAQCGWVVDSVLTETDPEGVNSLLCAAL